MLPPTFPLLAFALIALASFSLALPTRQGAAIFEPLFLHAAPVVGPSRSIERLRLRRRSPTPTPVVVVAVAPVVNSKVKRQASVVAAVATKSKRQADIVLSPPMIKVVKSVVANPKRKLGARAIISSSSTKAKRSLPVIARSVASDVVANPKTKRSTVPVATLPVSRRALANAIRESKVASRNPVVVSRRAIASALRESTRLLASVIPSSAAPLVSRQVRAGLEAVRKAKRSVEVTTNPKFARRSVVAVDNPKLAKRSSRGIFVEDPVIKVVAADIIPNPKSPSFPSLDVDNPPAASSSSSASSTASATSTASSTSSSITSSATSSSVTSSSATSSSTTSSSTTSSSLISSSPSTSTRSSTSTTPTTTSRSSTSSSTRATTVSSTSAAPSATGKSWPTSGKQISGGYYPDWTANILPPWAVNYKMFDVINFAFALPTSSFDLEFTQWNSEATLREVVRYAHGNNTKVLISIGGWTGSALFSNAVQNSANRKVFVANILKMVNKFDLDGVDLDWEYPGTTGNPGNIIRSSDTANFLLFLTSLRAALAPGARMSSCTTHSAFIGANGSPLADVAAFAEVLDNVVVMNYDVWGASSNPGANAPLTNACADSMQPNANADSAIKTWVAAGMPANKILLGVAAYGYISSSTATTLVHKRSNRDVAAAAHEDKYKSHGRRAWEQGQRETQAKRTADRIFKRAERKRNGDLLKKRQNIIFCPNNHSGKPCAGVTDQNVTSIDWNPLTRTKTASGPVPTGVFAPGVGVGKLGSGSLAAVNGNQVQFYQLIAYGVIVKSGDTWIGTNGYTRKWDTCSSTPYLYDQSRRVVVTYDDPVSLALKGKLAAEKKIAGLIMWDMAGDTDNWDLTSSWRVGMGLTALGV